jgi:hypothetical protein
MALAAALADADFERRWVAWQARGCAHERVVRRRFIVCAIVVATIAIGALAAYGLPS